MEPQRGAKHMTVFIGWSGETGQKLAAILKRWLGAILPEIRFTTGGGMELGSDWRSELQSLIQDADCGVFCLTKECEPSWLSFEAGMMVSKNPSALIIPLLFDIGRGDTRGPFSLFHSVTSDTPSILDLIHVLWEKADETGVEVPTLDVVGKRTNLMLPALRSDLNHLWEEKQKKTRPRLDGQEEAITEISKKLDAILSALPAVKSPATPSNGLSQSAYTRPS